MVRSSYSTESRPTEEARGFHTKNYRRKGSAITLNRKHALLEDFPLPKRVAKYPKQRYMGSKHRLLPWIHRVLTTLDFETVADPFVGSGCVAYLLKAMGKHVFASDFLNFPAVIASATVQNSCHQLDAAAVERVLRPVSNAPDFIARTFSGIFFSPAELRFLDRISANLAHLERPEQVDLARAAMIGACIKKQPRGVSPSRVTFRTTTMGVAICAYRLRSISLSRLNT